MRNKDSASVIGLRRTVVVLKDGLYFRCDPLGHIPPISDGRNAPLYWLSCCGSWFTILALLTLASRVSLLEQIWQRFLAEHSLKSFACITLHRLCVLQLVDAFELPH